MFKQFFKDSAVYGLSSILSRGISVILLPIYTRVFSPADYGNIEILTVTAALVNLTVALEISQGVARHYSDAETKRDKIAYASTALWFTVFMYSVFVVITFLLSKPLSKWILETSYHQNILRIWALSSLTNGIFYILQNQLRWQLQSKHYSITSIVYTLASAGMTVFLILVLDYGVIGVFYGLIAGGITGSLLALIFAKGSYKLIFDWHKCKEMLSFAAPLVPSSIAVFVSLYIDRIAIKELMTFDDLGLYGIGFRFASVVGILLIGFQSALTPLIYSNYQKPNTPDELSRIFSYFLALTLPFILGLAVFSNEILIIFTTPEYYSASQVIPLLAVAILLSNMYIFAPGLSIAKKTKLIATINIISAVVNTVLNFTLIPFLGISGAALATLISHLLAFSLYMIISQRFYFVPHKWKKIIISTIIVVIFFLICSGLEYVIKLSLYVTIISKAFLVVCGISLLIWLLIGAQEIRSLIKRVFLQVSPS
jgi:O-antigen/teichoic acid export membrane protein